MNYRSLIFVTMIALIVSACVREERAVKAQFSVSDHQLINKQGNATVSGQAFLRQQGGGVVRCSGEPVFIFPASAYFREVFGTWKSGFRPKIDGDLGNNIKPISKRTVCDADGKFKFENLPAGDWYLATQVRWNVGSAMQGGEILGEVTTRSGQKSEVILSDTNRV